MSSFPELREKIGLSKENEEHIVENFLKVIRKNNETNIKKSIEFIRNQIEKNGEKMLEILTNLMEYKSRAESPEYVLVPTIFPLSPFKNNTFFFSIYKSLQGTTEYPKVLAVSAHEISHIVLFNILRDEKIELSRDLLYFVKELIAPILVYQDDFSNVFKKEIVGNYNVLEIYFKDNDRIIKAFDFFLEKFLRTKAENKKFVDFLNEMIAVCRKIEKQISEKRAFDNKYGFNIMKDPELLKQFREPIYID